MINDHMERYASSSLDIFFQCRSERSNYLLQHVPGTKKTFFNKILRRKFFESRILTILKLPRIFHLCKIGYASNLKILDNQFFCLSICQDKSIYLIKIPIRVQNNKCNIFAEFGSFRCRKGVSMKYVLHFSVSEQ